MLRTYVNAQWEKDSSLYFEDGEGFWSKVANAEINGEILPNEAGESMMEFRVRTGDSKNPTKFIGSYHLFINGVEVVLALDETRPNEKRDEYGGSHIGWMKGNFVTESTLLHAFKLHCNDQYSGVDDANFYDPSHKAKYDEGYAKGLEDGGGGSPGGCTEEELEAVRLEGYNEGYAKGLEDCTGGGSYDEGYLAGERARKEKDQAFLNDMFTLPE